MTVSKLVLPLFFLFFFSACEEASYYEKSYVLQNEVWKYSDVLEFSFNIEDNETPYDLNLAIDHAKDYPFQNLYIKIITHFPSGEKVEDIVSLELAQKDGAWFGDCGSLFCLLNIPIQQNIHFKEKGNYKISIAQHMRSENLMGIKEVSFSIFTASK